MSRTVSKEDWAMAALYAMAEGGVAHVAVEPLAKRLGVTKGSFYWHFKTRDAVIEAAVLLWERLGTEAVIRNLNEIEDPRERLRQLWAASWDDLEHMKAEAALMAAAVAGDARIRPVYERVGQRRLAYVVAIYRSFGLSPAKARRCALTAYATYLGSLPLVALNTPGMDSARGLAAQVRHMDEVLAPRS